MRPWLCSNDHPREAGGTSVTHIANAHRTTIARPTKLPTFLLYSTVPVAQSAAVSLNLGLDAAFGAFANNDLGGSAKDDGRPATMDDVREFAVSVLTNEEYWTYVAAVE